MMLVAHTALSPTACAHDDSAAAPTHAPVADASVAAADSLDAFDDCDVPLDPGVTSKPEEICAPALRAPSPLPRTASPASQVPAPSSNLSVHSLMGENVQAIVPTPLDGGIALVSLTVGLGATRFVMSELQAIPTAGALVLAASLAAARMHGTQLPYTEHYGSSTPAGVVAMAAVYFACGLVFTGLCGIT